MVDYWEVLDMCYFWLYVGGEELIYDFCEENKGDMLWVLFVGNIVFVVDIGIFMWGLVECRLYDMLVVVCGKVV